MGEQWLSRSAPTVMPFIVVPLLLDSGSRLTASESQHQVQHGTRLDLVRLCSLLVVPVYISSAFIATSGDGATEAIHLLSAKD